MKASRTFAYTTLFLAACATPYQAVGFRGGYDGYRLSQNAYHVSFRGNGMTSETAIQKMFYRRCAELAANNNYRYFIVTQAKEDDEKGAMTFGQAEITTHGTASASGFNTVTYDQTSTYHEPTRIPVHKYTVQGTVILLREGEQPKEAMDSQVILAEAAEQLD